MWKLSYSYYWSLELYSGCEKPVYVVSSGDAVELFVNGKSKGFGRQDYRFLFTLILCNGRKGRLKPYLTMNSIKN